MSAQQNPTIPLSGGSQVPTSKQEVAHELLIELLTHQFAFPVNWIETQKHILDPDNGARRIIEIGPSSVLASMAKKSSAAIDGEKGPFMDQNREFLFAGNAEDSRKILYQYDESTNGGGDDGGNMTEEKKPAVTETGPVANNQVDIKTSQPALPQAPSVPVPMPSAAPATAIDFDVRVKDIIAAMVAQKVRKAFDELPWTDTIQGLCAGKSTLQNEIIGDLAGEFGDLPEGAETLPLEELASRLSAGFTGQPGKPVKKLMDRLMTSKMPGGFKQAELRGYLQSRWGLGTNAQTAIICNCITVEPASRLPDVTQAHALLDSVVQRYATLTGVSLSSASEAGSAGSSSQNTAAAASIQVDAASLEALKKEQNEYLRSQLRLLARHLNHDVIPSAHAESKQDDNAEEEEETTATNLPPHFQVEFDDEFINGVKGIFNPAHQRRYASWWNWVREDASRILLEGHHSSPSSSSSALLPPTISESRLQALSNRWSKPLEDMLLYGLTTPAKGIAEALLRLKPTTTTTTTSGSSFPPPVFKYLHPAMSPRTTVTPEGQIRYSEIPRREVDQSSSSSSSSSYPSIISPSPSPSTSHPPLLTLSRPSSSSSQSSSDPSLTTPYLQSLHSSTTTGLSFQGKTILLTGAGPGSIGFEVLRGLLSGGAKVIATTSRAISSAAPIFQSLYKECGSRGSELTLLPFNAGSKGDVEGLVRWIFSSSPDRKLDYIIPFAAVGESGREIDGLDGRSEVAHRGMLINVLRMLGEVKKEKERIYGGINGGPMTTVVLPLSPNHGDFGGDGLYGESKIGLETLFNRFGSENWGGYVGVIGAVIGWTRGTGLMAANNLVAEGVERMGVMTFTAEEMALNLLCLLTPEVVKMADEEPIYADLSGGLKGVEGLKKNISAIRKGIQKERRVKSAVAAERERQRVVLEGREKTKNRKDDDGGKKKKQLSNIRQAFPKLGSHIEMTRDLEDLKGMMDMSQTIVVVGYSELGPWGSARTRWQMESLGKLNLDGLTEMAWMMGLIKHVDNGIQGKPYVGWVDMKTGEAVHDSDFESRYGVYIMEHAGIRPIEPDEKHDNYTNPREREILHEIVLDHDLEPFEASESLASSFKMRHGDKVTIYPGKGTDDADIWTVLIHKGCTFLVPKSMAHQNFVTAQLPKGYDPARWGIGQDIISQVDPVTLYVLCCVCEAMYSAGIEDPYEIYRHMHVSELANCIGTGAGSLVSARKMYRHRFVDKDVQGDILQETFLNAMGAWTNMLLLGATGPIKTPSGTCATSIESLNLACETIQTGQAKMAIVGGADDLREEPSHEFSNMKATANAQYHLDKGYLPREFSRPTDTSRAGFIESAGCGIQLVTTAEMALKMSLPIYAVVAHTQLAGDGIGRSVPAPGKGILTAAKESSSPSSPFLSLPHRREAILKALRSNSSSSSSSKAELQALQTLYSTPQGLLRLIGPSKISPIRASLLPWGLDIDDLSFASFHGTSTQANDVNEGEVVDTMLRHLGRSRGNPLLVVAQKHLTGHPKGAAGAWMLNGAMQAMNEGFVPGNRNAGDVDGKLERYEGLVYPKEGVEFGGGGDATTGNGGGKMIKAFMLTSFGFGQKGGIVVGVNGRVVFAAIGEEEYEKYREGVRRRKDKVDRAWLKGMMGGNLFKAKDKAAWELEGKGAAEVFLDPEVRLG